MLNGGRKGQEPRRPLLLQNESRSILESISNNLKKSAISLKQQQNVTTQRGESPDFARHDNASVGNLGLSKPSNVTKSKKPKDLYTSKAFDEIRKTLHPYNKESGSEVQDASSPEVNKALLQQLTETGYAEKYDVKGGNNQHPIEGVSRNRAQSAKDKAILALRSTGNVSIEAAVDFLINKFEGKNGIHKTAFGFKQGRKNSLGTNSPGSDSASTRSESPGPSLMRQTGPGSTDSQTSATSSSSKMSRVLSPTTQLPNGTQTPPPVPPRLPLGTSGIQTLAVGHGQSPLISDSSFTRTSVTPTSSHSQSTPNTKKLSLGNSPYGANDSIKNVQSSIIQSSTPNIQKVTSTPVSIHGGVTPGISPVQVTRNTNDKSQKYGSPSSVGTSSPGSVTIRYQQHLPPPYPQQSSQSLTGTQVIIHGHNQQRPSCEIQLRRNQTADGVQINVSQSGLSRPVPAKPTFQPQIVTQKVVSKKVSKPNPQIAQAPAPQIPVQQQPLSHGQKYISSVQTQVNGPLAQQQQQGKVQIHISPNSPNPAQVLTPSERQTPDHYSQFSNQRHNSQSLIKIQIEGNYPHSETSLSTPQSGSPHSYRHINQSPLSVSSTPSTSSDIPERPPPPYPGPTRPPLMITDRIVQGNPVHPQPVQIVTPIPKNPQPAYGVPLKAVSRPADIIQGRATAPVPHPHYQQHKPQQQLQQEHQPPLPPRVPLTSQVKPPPPPPPSDSASDNYSNPPMPHKDFTKHEIDINTEQSDNDFETMSETSEASTQDKRTCTSPIPERKEPEEKDILRRDTLVRNYSPQAFKFYMEQHIENLMKNYNQRQTRRVQLEKEMAKANLSDEAQHQVRRMLQQKESNYIRMKRSKMNKDMFDKIKTLGVGAFGEVALVRKKDSDVMQLYAMKTLRKIDVLKRNQVAHVKAERDILAEADNEWVVKLYYSFQDRDNLYFVMDYVPGGDLMGLLIKLGIFEESLAKFYISELVVAIESVHKMGFIHRDIKPDNILIDKDGHIKLTDFGLCTGFRWTHNSKYYQKDDFHSRQDSMDINCSESPMQECHCNSKKPLERRKQRERQRCLAHSLVGTPNYIAPEVLLRQGYTSCCDWWSVGVIMYEMLVGQPPFYAQSPQETQFKVIHWEKTLRIPKESNLSQPATDLILRLCCGAENRLGSNGANEIKAHRFFANVKFEGLRKQRALYEPKIKHPMDTSNFDPVEERDEGSDSENDHRNNDHRGVNGTYPEHAFFEFTFKRFFDDGGHPYPTVREYRERERDRDRQHTQDTESNSESNSPVYV